MPAPPTALSSALARIGDRWSLLLVEALMPSPLRYADLQDAVSGISSNILAARLRRLEAEGVVMAIPYSERPRRYAYELTAAGQELGGAVRLLSQWSADHGGPPTRRTPTAGEPPEVSGAGGGRESAGTPIHLLCGTPTEAVWWCPTCEQRATSDGPETVWV